MATVHVSWSKPPVYPAVPVRLLPGGSQPTSVPWRLFLVRRVCVLCHPGAASEPAEASSFAAFRKEAPCSKLPAFLTTIVRHLGLAPKRWAWRRAETRKPADNFDFHGAEALRISPLSICGCCRVGVPLVQQPLEHALQVPVRFHLFLGFGAPASTKATASLP